MDHLRQGIHLRGYAQKNPKQEYKREAFVLFADMLDRIKASVVGVLMTVQIRSQEDLDAIAEQQESEEYDEPELLHDSPSSSLSGENMALSPDKLAERGLRVGRNDPCISLMLHSNKTPACVCVFCQWAMV